MIFNENGRRDHFVLQIIELATSGFIKIGTWDNINSVNYTRTFSEAYEQTVMSLQNKTVRVVSRIGRPFLDVKLVLKFEKNLFQFL